MKSKEESKDIILSDKPFKEIEIISAKQELVIFVGSPGCGKSTFWQNYLSSYVRVNNDTLKTPEKCMKVCKESLVAGKSVVIDNTNPTQDVRKRYIAIA